MLKVCLLLLWVGCLLVLAKPRRLVALPAPGRVSRTSSDPRVTEQVW